MKKTYSTIVVLGLVVLLWNCQGKTGDPGPTGQDGAIGATGAIGAAGANGADPTAAYINGGYTGTITGTMSDGTTPINETFNYVYDLASTGISAPVGGVQNVILYRFESLYSTTSLLEFPLIIKPTGGPYIDSIIYNTYFSFNKALAGGQQLKIVAPPVLTKYTIVFPVDPANADYPFDFEYSFPQQYHDAHPSLSYSNGFGYYFNTKLGEQVYYDWSSGAFLKIVDAKGVVSTTSATYGDLILNQGSTPDYSYYYFTKDGVDLSKTVNLPADTYSITNYSYDTSSGNMKFDFTLAMGGYPKPNSTKNPLTIKGSFSGVVRQIVNGNIKSDDGVLSH